MTVFEVTVMYRGEEMIFGKVAARSKVQACMRCFDFLKQGMSDEDFIGLAATAKVVRGVY